MTPPDEVVGLAAKLSEAQRKYLRAVAASDGPYEPRHGRTANWALNHKLTDAIIRTNNGHEGPWESFSVEARCDDAVEFLGQRLTPLGLQVLTALRVHLTGGIHE